MSEGVKKGLDMSEGIKEKEYQYVKCQGVFR